MTAVMQTGSASSHSIRGQMLKKQTYNHSRPVSCQDKDLSNGDLAARLLTAQEVADMLAVSLRTIRGWLATGKLASVRLPGRIVRVKTESVEELIEAHFIN